MAAVLAGPADAAPPSPGSQYVSLGSSYAAGTSLPRLADDSLPGCGQGAENYPRQVARALSLKLVDRSCGAATTTHILDGGQFGQPAQVAGVDAETALVTVTIGGNDVRFVADLGRYSCRHRATEVSEAARPFACSDPPAGFDLDAAFSRLETQLRDLVAEVRRRAPRARIVFVDYVTVVPARGACAALGLAEDEASQMRGRATRLAALTAKVARDTGADLIEASRLTADHDVCSASPWAWGFVPASERERSNAAGFHPRPEAIRAVADAIVRLLRS